MESPANMESSVNMVKSSASSQMNPSDDSSSPYYLQPSDNPGALLVSKIFNGANYVAWSRSISIALTVKNKLAFVDGSLPQPSPDNTKLQVAWLRANNLVLSWLMNSIAKEIRGSLLYFNTTFDIWDELKNLADRQQADYVMKFLVGLHDSYSAIRSQLLLSPLPSMGKVFSLLLQEKSQRSLTNAVGLPLDSHAMAAAQPPRQIFSNASKFIKLKGKPDVTCSHCGFSGHLADKCFQIIGYPPGWKGPRGKRFNSTRLPNANNASSLEQNSNIPNIAFSQEQIHNLITLANSLSTSPINPNHAVNIASTSGNHFTSCLAADSLNNNSPWILDTGATYHMICSPQFFTSIKLPTKPSSVQLPNGQSVPISFTGTVKLSSDLDLNKWKMIGLAEVRAGLYHLINFPTNTQKGLPDSNNSFSANTSTISPDIWHSRLGHLSPARLKIISSIDSSVKSSHKHMPIHVSLGFI
ncbi:uncharacterized protein LOC121249450 [Juglans microcarpa x Juglans regia]|uniref:uncharacterized protein LOC121249450 n=1 Tax=Juglans microcarpa x Juglans regia TaxID=2249226 RepID=UPI001B7DACA0|nr:uncharacterized protein LOC121249450 [Juglans microcarpa x Juglans regia]